MGLSVGGIVTLGAGGGMFTLGDAGGTVTLRDAGVIFTRRGGSGIVLTAGYGYARATTRHDNCRSEERRALWL